MYMTNAWAYQLRNHSSARSSLLRRDLARRQSRMLLLTRTGRSEMRWHIVGPYTCQSRDRYRHEGDSHDHDPDDISLQSRFPVVLQLESDTSNRYDGRYTHVQSVYITNSAREM